MKQTIAFKNVKGKKEAENIFAPVSLSGFVVPWAKTMSVGMESEFKLVCSSGQEYFFVVDDEWKQVLILHCWNEVKVKGLLNIVDLTIIPQKIFPKGPRGELENVIDLATWKARKFVKKIINDLNDQVIIPVAVLILIGTQPI